MSSSRLFEPIKVGAITLKQRIAMAPLTRFRADGSHVPLPIVTEYYGQRASVPGTLLVTEGTFIGPQYGGYANVPGIYSDDQITAWKTVTDAVHKKGSYIFLQLWALGRTADPSVAEKEGITIKSSSPVPLGEYATPLAYTQEDIDIAVQAYATAAKNAIAAGFDGVEIHGANGYLIDQFIQDKVNQRTDKYGGSIENRSRFAIEVAQAVVAAVGPERTGIRLSPFSEFQGMRMDDPYPQFTDVIQKLDALNLAYVHLVTSRVSGILDLDEGGPSIAPLIKHFRGTILAAGGFRAESAKKLVDEEFPDRDVVVVFGRFFISTPDLVFRIKQGLEFNEYDRSTFYSAGETKGYIDQPFSAEYLAQQAPAA